MLVSNSLTYTINVTNLTGITLPDVLVTNQLPASVVPLSYSISPQGFYTNYGSVVVFDLGQMIYGQSALLQLTVEPTTAGLITNTVTVTSISVTNIASTNSVTQVTNAVILADLGVTLAVAAPVVITNDLMTYEVIVTNYGPNAAPNVLLTNTLLLANGAQTNSAFSTNYVFNLGTITNGGQVNFRVSVQPANAGVLTLTSIVGAAGVTDLNLTNNSASTNISVIGYLAGTLVAVTNSAQTLNLQNGLEEQSILVSNIGTNAVPAVRVVVTGLSKQLYNAVETNGANPFVVYGSSLAAGQSVNLLLQFNPRGSFPFTNSQLQAYAVPLPNLSAPTFAGTNVPISRIVKLPNGSMLIEFPSTEGQSYAIEYSDSLSFSNAMLAMPATTAPANETLWIDYGPPATVSQPASANARFYRVFHNP